MFHDLMEEARDLRDELEKLLTPDEVRPAQRFLDNATKLSRCLLDLCSVCQRAVTLCGQVRAPFISFVRCAPSDLEI